MQLFEDLTKESSSIWKGGVYKFSAEVGKDYPFGRPFAPESTLYNMPYLYTLY